MKHPIEPTVFPTELFDLAPDVRTVQGVIDQLAPLGLECSTPAPLENSEA